MITTFPISCRCDTLIRCIEREFEDPNDPGRKTGGGRGRGKASVGPDGDDEAGKSGPGRKKRNQVTPVPGSEDGTPPPSGKRTKL